MEWVLEELERAKRKNLQQVFEQALGDCAVDLFVVGLLRFETLDGLGDFVVSDFGDFFGKRHESGDFGGFARLGRDVDLVGPARLFGSAAALIFLARLI